MKSKRILLPAVAVIAAAFLASAGGWLVSGGAAEAQMDLPAPANVRAADGDSLGEAVVSWEMVAGAAGYTVRWVDVFAANDAFRDGDDWQHLIDFKDVAAEVTTFTVSDLTPGKQYAFGVGSVSGPNADPAWSDWETLTLLTADETGMVTAAGPVEILGAALAITRHAGALDAVGSEATHGGMTPESLGESAREINIQREALNRQLAILDRSGQDARVRSIRNLVNRLVANIELIQRGRRPLFNALRLENSSREQLIGDNRDTLFLAVDTSLDEQFYNLMTGVDDGSAGSGGPTGEDLLRYTHTNSLASNVTLGHTLLLVASLMQEPAFVARVQETYDSVAGRTDRDIEYLRVSSGHGLGPDMLELAENVRDAQGQDDQTDYFDRLEHRLRLTSGENARIEDNEKILDDLLTEIDGLAAVVQGRPAPAIATMPETDPGVPGVTANRIVFGQSAAFSGPNEGLGTGLRLGIQAAFREANQTGGVNGRMLILVDRDDGYEPDLAFANTLSMIESGQVFALIGAVGTPTSRAALPLAEAEGVPFVAPFTGAQLLRESDLTNVLNLRASYHEEAARMVEYLAGQGKTRVAVLYQNDSYGVDGLSGVKTAVERHDGMELVASWYYRRNTSNVKSAVFRIAGENPDAVIFVGTHAPTAAAIKMLRTKLDSDTVYMSVSFVGSNALAESLGEDGEGVHVSQVVPMPDGDSIPVLAQYRAALAEYNATAAPGFVSLEGYLAGRMAIDGLKACGDDVSRECFLNAVHGLEDLSGFELMFGPMDNQGSDAVFLTMIGPDGEYDPVD